MNDMKKTLVEGLMLNEAVNIKEYVHQTLGEKAIVELDKYKKKLAGKIFNSDSDKQKQDD